MNIDDSVQDIKIKTGVSKTGNNYRYLSIMLVNGYELKLFPHPAELAVIDSLLKVANK